MDISSIPASSRPETAHSAANRMPAHALRLPLRRLGLLLALLVVMFMLALILGSVAIPLEDILKVLGGGDASRPSWTNIILKIRLPKALTAIFAGGALGLSGLMMQTFFRNPLAGPYILGISSGASLGVALVVLGGAGVGSTLLAGLSLQGDLLIALAAAIGAGASLSLVLLIARRVESSFSLLLLGVMFGYVTSALVSFLMYTAVPERIQAYTNWTFGSFAGITWSQMPLLAGGCILGVLITLLTIKPLNALLLGEAYAETMGLNIARARLLIIAATALLAGTVTAFCGPIGFIGTAIPHVCRAILNTSDHRALVPATLLSGAVFGLMASLLAEAPGTNAQFPLNVVTALFGAPVVIYVILRQRNMQRAFGG